LILLHTNLLVSRQSSIVSLISVSQTFHNKYNILWWINWLTWYWWLWWPWC